MNTIATRTEEDPRLLIIDTETTGLMPEYDHVMCELCILEPNLALTEAKVNLWFFELTDEEIGRGSREAYDINRYFERLEEMEQSRHWVSIKNRVRVAQDVLALTEDSILCGDNVAFDANFLKYWLRKLNLEPNWNYHLLELESMAIGFFGGDAPYPWNSAVVSKATNVPPPGEGERHTALGDAVWNMKRLKRILKLHEVEAFPKLHIVRD